MLRVRVFLWSFGFCFVIFHYVLFALLCSLVRHQAGLDEIKWVLFQKSSPEDGFITRNHAGVIVTILA